MSRTRQLPRYRQLAEDIRSDILSGRLKPGDHIPTEMELCAHHQVSRHTARDALRILTEEGLLTRRKGSGTVVQEQKAPAFAQSLSDFDSILQYARDAAFELMNSRKARREELHTHGLTGEYVRLEGLRGMDGQPPLALTRIFALRELCPDAETLATLDGSISEWIEQVHGIGVARVTQRMEAVALGGDEAKLLGVKPTSPALRTVRRYRDHQDQTILLSESLHPAGRFAYEMSLDRQH